MTAKKVKDMQPHQEGRIFVTHCSAKKDKRYKGTGESIGPDLLYTSKPIQRFMNRCKARGVRWAIFSDLYGVWFPEVTHEWYEKAPETVTEAEFLSLLRDFDVKLNPYSSILFYHNPGRFHPLYARLLECSQLKGCVKTITHWWEIV